MANGIEINAYAQIVDTLSQGIIVLNREMRIVLWNRWMEEHSRLDRVVVLGEEIAGLFPDLEKKGFFWKARSVFRLGSYAFFSQDTHGYIFPFAARYLETEFDLMQQSVILAPLYGSSGQVEYICVTIQDETDMVLYKGRLEDSNCRLKQMAQTDSLTGLANRGHIIECLDSEIIRQSRLGGILSLAILDIDYFKAINDTYGHLCGDEVLVQFAKLLRNHLRGYDMVGRYGGEEFAVVLPGVSLADGMVVVDRLRHSVACAIFEYEGKSITITISAGITSIENRGQVAPDLLMRLADEALYEAKNSGRNQVRMK